jgi:hypothetical protein
MLANVGDRPMFRYTAIFLVAAILSSIPACMIRVWTDPPNPYEEAIQRMMDNAEYPDN